MDRLPDLVIDEIASFLPYKRLSQFATLSSAWQRAIERRTFLRLRINSSDEDMNQLARVVLPKRCAYLRRLSFYVLVPFNEGSIKDRNQQQAMFSDAFTTSVQRLFRILADGIPNDDRRLTLELGWVMSQLDWQGNKEPRYLHQRIGLVSHGQQLPLVRCVSHLILLVDACGRRVALQTIVDLIKRLPSLEHATLAANDVGVDNWSGEGATLHQDDRAGIATALVDSEYVSGMCPAYVTLSIESQDPFLLAMNPQFVFPDCTNSLTYDPLSTALRTWSHSLVSLDVCGVFDRSLFWPNEKDSLEMPASPWPRLREFHSQLGLTTPMGGWYFNIRPGTTRRDVPCEDTVQPLIESWVKALESMPILEQATIFFRVEIGITEPGFASPTSIENWTIGFQAPGIAPDLTRRPWETDLTTHDMRSPRLFFQNLGSWRPWSSTMKRIHQMAKDKFTGTCLIEYEVDPLNHVKMCCS
ncbi:hypothetical protein F4801DRAFT_122604 [Xylaria longipes]|nr:hypothetical protein F4801DRAFT_122604 [Xylaria longipes]RYC62743.1 hypothetical protein CHU98_g3461 [Xylaria longipes]